MAIDAEQVRELREKTGAGMMDCKRALEHAGGDQEKALSFLREKGLASAAKRAGRTASEGLVGAHVSPDRKVGALVEVNCETDFVARNDEFAKFVEDLVGVAAAEDRLGLGEQIDGQMMKEMTLPNGEKAVEALTNLAAKIGEHLTIRRLARFQVTDDAGIVESYIHLGGKIGVLIMLSCGRNKAGDPAVAALARDLAMQVAAARPDYISRNDVPAEIIEREKSIYKAQALNEGKPEQVAEKIVNGRLEKFFKEICLLEQAFVKDQNQSCRRTIEAVEAQIGSSITVQHIARFEKGEGLE